MELAKLKKEIHASVDELNDEQALLEVAEVLGVYIRQSKNEYEKSVDFKVQLDEAVEQADKGELSPHDESVDWLKNRAWRSK
jgi:hemerythrin superfamily protein